MKKHKVTWAVDAIESLGNIYAFIHHQSPAGADRVFQAIHSMADSLDTFPERHPPENLLRDFGGNYRSAPVGNYKIIYRVDDGEVVIMQVFDTRRDPGDLLI